MATILKNIDLKPYTTFGLSYKAAFFVEINTIEELHELFEDEHFKLPRLIIGGGSNILLTKDFEGIAIHINLKGIYLMSEDSDSVVIRAEAGENWNEFVDYCVDNNWSGIENLVEIPGNVGSCPIQNIGAYGAEVKDIIMAVEAVNIETKHIEYIPVDFLEMGYRSSIFKHQAKDKYIIIAVSFILNKAFTPNINYADVQKELAAKSNITMKDVADAIRTIRKRKLPDFTELGNAGSFFKNPYLCMEHFNSLKSNYPTIPSYQLDDDVVKVPAAWFIDQCNWKGYRKGDVGVHANQALVLVNYGNATGMEIKQLSEEIQTSVLNKFGVTLETEVNII